MNRRLFAILALLIVPGLVSAGPYRYYSTCYPSYSYSYATPYYAPTYYQPTYYAAPTYTAPVAPAVPAYSKDWRTSLIDYNAALKEIEAYNQALSTVVPGYAASHSAYYSGQGQTLYGVAPYSVKAATITENVGVNLELADQRSARLLDGIKDSMSQGFSQRQDFLTQSSQDNSRGNEITRKGNAAALVLQQAAALLQSADAAPSSKTTTTYSGPVIQPNVADSDMQTFLKTVALPACASCHSGAKKSGGMDITQYASFTPEQKAALLDRITTDDLNRRMPRLADGKPGKLSIEGIRGFATH